MSKFRNFLEKACWSIFRIDGVQNQSSLATFIKDKFLKLLTNFRISILTQHFNWKHLTFVSIAKAFSPPSKAFLSLGLFVKDFMRKFRFSNPKIRSFCMRQLPLIKSYIFHVQTHVFNHSFPLYFFVIQKTKPTKNNASRDIRQKEK